ncbi:MAG: M15 family metallopeptidase [Patescibacteria group bacterium]
MKLSSRSRSILATLIVVFLFFILIPFAHAQQTQTQVMGVFTPNTPVPGTPFANGVVSDNTLFSRYIGAVYAYGLAVSITVATVMFIWGAFRYLLAAGNVGTIAKAKSTMVDSVIGLLLLFGANLILRTLNPNLVTLRALNLTTIQMETVGPTGTITERTPGGVIWVTPVLGHPKGNLCLLNTFGKSDSEVTSRLMPVTFLGDTYRFHTLAAQDFQAAFSEIESAPSTSPTGHWVNLMRRMAPYAAGCGNKAPYPDRGSRTGGSYVPRMDSRITSAAGAGGIPCLSCDLHALGLAVDLDPCFNQMCKTSPCAMTDPSAERIPADVINIFAKHHIYWGGLGWKAEGQNLSNPITGRDPMHFEWHGVCWQ